MNLWVAIARNLPWILGAASLLATASEVCASRRTCTAPRGVYIGVGLLLLGGLLATTRLGWQILWGALTVAWAGYVAWRLTTTAADVSAPERVQSPPQAVAAGVLRTLARLNWAEVAVVFLAAPVLWFPALRPQLTLLALLGLALVWAAVCAAGGGLWPASRYDLALWVLLVMVALGALRTSTPVLALPKAAGLLLGVAVYRLILRLVRSPRSAVVAVFLAIGLGLLFTIVGLVNGLRPTKVTWLGEQLARLPRWVQALPGAEGGRVSMNQLGGALLFVLPLAVGLALCPPAKKSGAWPLPALERVLAVVLAALLTTAVALCQSRAAWLGLASALLLILALRWPWGRWVVIGLLAAGLAWAWFHRGEVAAWLGLMAERGSVETAVGSLSLAGRVSIWERAVACVRESPILGCGLGAFRALDADVVAAAAPFDVGTPHAHQVFLQVAADTGLPGLIAYLALLMLAWKQAWRLYRRGQGAARGMAIGFLAALVSSHVYGLADVVALGSKPGVLWWVLLALVAGVSGLGSGQASVDVVGRNKHA